MIRNAITATLIIWLNAMSAFAQTERNPDASERRYTISEQTTRITGPLNEDGSLNFFGAINERLSKGVTPENNAARLIFGTFPYEWEYLSAANIVILRNDIQFDLLPVDYPRLVTMKSFMESNNCPDFEDRYTDFLDPPRPIDANEFPLFAKYVHENAAAIDAIVEACQLERLYTPLHSIGASYALETEMRLHDEIAEPNGNQEIEANDIPDLYFENVRNASINHMQETRRIARLMVCRIMLRISDAEYALAWSDILALRRLGKLVGSQSSLNEGVAGIAIVNMACEAARELILHATDPNQPHLLFDWQAMARQWGEEFEVANVSFQIDVGERLARIELLTLLADNKISWGCATGILIESRKDNPQVDTVMKFLNESGQLDWNEGLRWVNTFFDRQVANIAIIDHAQRIAAHEQLKTKLHDLEMSVPWKGSRLMSDWVTPEEKVKIVCGVLLALDSSTGGQVANAELRVRSCQKVIALGLNSLHFHDVHGRFPESGKELGDNVGNADLLVHSSDGRDLEIENNNGQLGIWYRHNDDPDKHTQYLDFGLEIAD